MSQVTDMTQRYDPVGNNSYSTASNPWAGFFGTPPYPYKTSAYDKYDRHNWNLPEAYVGQNKMLKSTVDELIYTDEDWYTTAALPYEFTDQVSVAWDKWEFNEHFTNIVPEQGVSRLVSSHKEQRSESFLRRGLAAIFEHGFMSTPEGRSNYVLTLRQISRAVKETTNFGVIYAYLTAHNFNRAWEEKHGYFKKSTLPEILARQKYMWAIAQKEKNGMEKLDAQIVEWMNRYRGAADTWILPPKLTIYLRLVPSEKTDQYIAGDKGPDRVNNIAGAGRPHEQNAPSKRIHDIVEPFALFAKNKVYITRTYHVDKTGPIDLMSRVSQIGEYNVALSEKECDTENYKSCNRSIRVYDETNDRGVTLSLQDFLDSCNLFDAETGNLRQIGDSREADDVQDMLQDFLLRQVTDPRTGMVNLTNVTHFGDINEQYMSIKSIGALSQTVINSIYGSKASREQAQLALNNGMAVINRLNNTRFKNADNGVGEFHNDGANASAPTRFDVNAAGARGVGANNDQTDFPGSGATAQDMAGFTSWGALQLIDNYGAGGGAYVKSIQPIIQDFVATVRQVVDRVTAILNPGDNLFLDGRNAGPWNLENDRTSYATFYENLLNQRAVPVFRLGAAAGGAGQAGDQANLRTAFRTMRGAFAEVGANARVLRANGFITDAAPGGTPEYLARLAEVNDIVTAAGVIQPGRVTRQSLEALAAILRNNVGMTLSEDSSQLNQWLGEILESERQANAFAGAAAARQGGAVQPDAAVYNDARMTILMAYATNPSFANRETNANLGFDLASRFDLTRVRDADRAVVGAGAAARHVASIGSQWNANEMPMFVGMAAANQYMNQPEQQAAYQRDDAYRVGTGLAQYQTVGRMVDLDVGRVQRDNVWIPAAGGALGMAGEADNLRIGNIAYLLNKISTSPMTTLQKLGAAAYIGAPVRKNVLDSMIAANVIFPMNFIKANPHARYEMALGIKTKAGKDTGATYFGHSNFMLSDDATVKVHYGNYTHYGKSVIHNEKNVFIAYDIFANAALGGLGVRPYIYSGPGRTVYAPENAQEANRGFGADMFVFAIPYEERDIPNPLDISGRFYSYMDNGYIDEVDPSQRKIHFTTAGRYNRMWGFYNPANVMDEIDEPLYRTQFANVNRVCWQGAQGGFNSDTKKFDQIIRNTGHWGADVSVGCRACRDGRMREIEKVPFGQLGF